MKCAGDVIRQGRVSANRQYQSRAGCVKLTPRFSINFVSETKEASWRTQKNVKTHRALANLSQAKSIAARRAKVLATQSNSIAIAATKSAREISNPLGVRWLVSAFESGDESPHSKDSPRREFFKLLQKPDR